MESVRRTLLPKHQVLIRKCYPTGKFRSSTSEVKPNSSELSYLLYYISTRRSKLQKVGEYLEKRTSRDVPRRRMGNVQVTLHILSAIVDKCSRDLSLYVGSVLRILHTVLQSNDITLIEYSVPTYEVLCAHQDSASLTSDKGVLAQFEELLQLYAVYASKEQLSSKKSTLSVPLIMRYRKAGLQAIKGAVPSVALWAFKEKVVDMVVPVLLENVYSEDPSYIFKLRDRMSAKEETEKDFAFKRKQSMSTVWTADTAEADAQAASGTIEDADKLAEEEVGMISLQTLGSLFAAVNRGQLHWVTSSMLRFIMGRSGRTRNVRGDDMEPEVLHTWPTNLCELACEWARVQDRFTILVTAVETLTQISVHNDILLDEQFVLASVIDSLLCSSTNFIGLSVMDVLVSLMQHMLLHLRRLEASRTSIAQSQQLEANADANVAAGQVDGACRGESMILRARVVGQLRKSFSGLATHVYYSDQISDMILTILCRLKPTPPPGSALAIQQLTVSGEASANPGSMQEKFADRSYSSDMARLTALLAVKEILIVANTRSVDGSYGPVSRSKVALSVWEGSEWLLRDTYTKVRHAYVDALLAWLKLELGSEALRLPEESNAGTKLSKGIFNDTRARGLERKALSMVLNQDGTSKHQRRRFLRSLHLVIYEMALQQTQLEQDILLLHLLLVNMVEKLGVNALRDGLPMMMRLQEDIKVVQGPLGKIQLGSLVHGYLQKICSVFDLEHSSIGKEIYSEVERRKEKGMWIGRIRLPPHTLDQIEALGSQSLNDIKLPESFQNVILKPFDRREQLIDRITFAYSNMSIVPPTSPSGRMHSRSFSSQFGSASISTLGLSVPAHPLPAKVREDLLSDWTKEACLAHATHDSSRSGSLNGSKTVPAGNSRDLLAVNIPSGNVGFSLNTPATLDPHNKVSSTNNNGKPPHSASSYRRPSTAARQGVGASTSLYESDQQASGNGTPLQLSTSSLRSSIRVEDLKRALSINSTSNGNNRAKWRGITNHTQDPTEDTASESMVSADLSGSDTSGVARTATLTTTSEKAAAPPPVSTTTTTDMTATNIITTTDTTSSARDSTPSTPRTPQTSHPSLLVAHGSSPPARAARELPSDLIQKQPDEGDEVPPVPPLPASLQAAARASMPAQQTNTAALAVDQQQTSIAAENQATTGAGAGSVHKSRSAKVLRANSNPPGGSRRAMSRSIDSSIEYSNLLDSINVAEEIYGDGILVGNGAKKTRLRPPS